MIGASEPLTVFLHIPKTAGTSLTHLLRENLGPARIVNTRNVFKGRGGYDPTALGRLASGGEERYAGAALIAGHLPYAVREQVPERARYFTFLRDPVDRLLSHYYVVIHPLHTGRRMPGVTDETTLDELIERGILFDNLCTRMLAGEPDPLREVDTAMLRRAEENLKTLALVGIVERFDESVALLGRLMELRSLLATQTRVNPARPRTIPPELVGAAKRHSRFDAQLYRSGVRLLEEALAAAPAAVAFDIEALRLARTPGALPALPRDASLEQLRVRERARLLRREQEVGAARMDVWTAEAELDAVGTRRARGGDANRRRVAAMLRAGDGNRAREGREGADGLVVFVHIQKTAGLTLRKIMLREYGGRRAMRQVPNYFAKESSVATLRRLLAAPPGTLRAIHGHMLLWDAVEWPEDARLVTLLRDPVERAISHYYWLMERKLEARSVLGVTIDEAVESGEIRDNMQTRVLAGRDPQGPAGRELLDAAIANLDRFAVVGLTERFDESLFLLGRQLGWRTPFYERENVSATRVPRAELSRDTIALIEHRNALDAELYDHARQRFERDLAAHGEEGELEVAAFKRANAQRTAGAPPRGRTSPLVAARADALLRESALLTELDELRDTAVQLERARVRAEARLAELGSLTKARARVTPQARDDRLARIASSEARASERLNALRARIAGLERDAPARTSDLARLRKREADATTRLERLARRRAELLATSS